MCVAFSKPLKGKVTHTDRILAVSITPSVSSTNRSLGKETLVNLLAFVRHTTDRRHQAANGRCFHKRKCRKIRRLRAISLPTVIIRYDRSVCLQHTCSNIVPITMDPHQFEGRRENIGIKTTSESQNRRISAVNGRSGCCALGAGRPTHMAASDQSAPGGGKMGRKASTLWKSRWQNVSCMVRRRDT